MWELTLLWQESLGCDQGRPGTCILTVPRSSQMCELQLSPSCCPGHCYKARKHARSVRHLSQRERGRVPSQTMPWTPGMGGGAPGGPRHSIPQG